MAQEHFDYLDGWRGLAICMLLVGHFFPVPGINLGAVGVNLFFVLSGLLMSRLLFVKHTPIGLFYKRRISRIIPAHVTFIVSVTACFLVLDLTPSWTETAAALLFVNNYFPGEPGQALMPFGHIWSLSVEEHSYIVLSLVALASRRYGAPATKVIVALALLSVLAGVGYWMNYSGRELEFGKWLHTEVMSYGIWMSALLFLFLARRQEAQLKVVRLPAWTYPILLLLGIAVHWWSVPLPVRTFVGVGVFALTLNLLFAAPDVIKRALSFMPLRLMGLWSFSIYLWQQPFYLLVHRQDWPKHWALLMALGMGLISFYALEQPVRRYLNRVWGKDGG